MLPMTNHLQVSTWVPQDQCPHLLLTGPVLLLNGKSFTNAENWQKTKNSFKLSLGQEKKKKKGGHISQLAIIVSPTALTCSQHTYN